MATALTLTVGDATVDFSLDFDKHEWTAGRELHEGEFPLVAEVEGKRYELYSNGTFAEEELP